MRSWLFAFSSFLMACGAAAQSHTPTHIAFVAEASGGSQTSQSVHAATWIGAAPAQTHVVSGSDGQGYLGVWIDIPDQTRAVVQRAPLDLSLVIDNSGSMSGDKIAHARMAAVSMLESLANGDIVSIYTFDSVVREIAAPTVIEPMTRGALIQRIGTIVPMGSTNLYGGLQAGEARAAQAPGSHPVRRVVLISDGMANVGPSSPEELGNLAARGTESGVQVSAIGVGIDYDERTLSSLAVRSSGRLYHLAEPSQMAAILREEIQLLSNTVASDAYIEIVPAPGVQILGTESVQGTMEQGKLRVPLGSLYGGQHREMLIHTRMDTSGLGERPLASARLFYRDPSGARSAHTQDVAVRLAVTTDANAAARSIDGRVQAMVASNQAAQVQLQAAQMLNQGQARQATVALERAEQQLRAAAAAAPATPARERLVLQADRIRAGRTSAAGASTPSAARASALQNNADAFGAMGY